VAKDVWEFLRIDHEGIAKVRMSRLQLLTTKFEKPRMNDDETIHKFHSSILDISNTSCGIGEKMLEEKLARKILRSLPKKYDMNVTTINEARDISNVMKEDELIGHLQIVELAINDSFKKEKKSITFIFNTNEKDVQCEMDTYESILDAILLRGRKFNKVLNRMD
jgi:hypothetical protein